jgi:hypothetical protein
VPALNSLAFTIGTVTTFGWPSDMPSRVMHGTILLAGTLIYYHWEAMLISYLSIKVTALPFHSLKEMLEQSSYRLALMPGSAYEDAFKFSNDPLWQQVYEERIKPYLEEYMKYGVDTTQLAMKGDDTALYNNYFQVS